MTEELTKAAQQAHTPEHIAGVDHAHELLRRQGYHRDGDYFINVNRRGAEAIHVLTISLIVHAGQLCALTQRPAAQTEREAFENWLGIKPCGAAHDLAWDAWKARASLPASQQATPGWIYAQVRVVDENTVDIGRAVAFADEQATPEPVGEPVARVELMQTGGNAGLATRIVEIYDPLRERLRPGDLLFAHPAPGVPEDVRTALEFYAGGNHFVRADADAWETVSGEPPNFWEDEANTATVEDGTTARNALAALAAAQAKGGEHD